MRDMMLLIVSPVSNQDHGVPVSDMHSRTEDYTGANDSQGASHGGQV